MRLAAMMCALAIGAGFGAFLWQGASVSSGPISGTQTGPAVGLARAVLPKVEEQSVPSANTPSAKLTSASDVPPSALTALTQGSLAVATMPTAARSQAPAAVARAGFPWSL